MPILIALLVIFIVLAGILFVGYNRLQQMRNVIDRTFAQVDTVLQKRANLIPNLIEVTKGYAKHERETLTRIAQERAKAAYTQNPAGRADTEIEVARDIRKILALREAYPDLKANEDFLNLMNQLKQVEFEIAEQREAFNNVVKVYNDYVGTFPTSYLAPIFGFAPAPYFEFGPDAQALPSPEFTSHAGDDLIKLGPVGDADDRS